MKAPAVLTRRRFLQMAASTPLTALSAPPALALFASILEGQSHNAWAAEMGIKPRAFVNITAEGGPARWMYNNFLVPYEGVIGFDPHPMVTSEFKEVGGRYIGAQYVSYDMKGIKVPTFWTHNIPTPGGYRPVADLLDNMLCVQGINTRNDGHTESAISAQLPAGAKQSAAALSADAADLPFSAINLGALEFKFKSTKSKSSVTYNARNGPMNLLLPFQPISGAAKYIGDKGIFDSALTKVMPELDSLARKGHKGAQAVIENRQSAVKLAQTNFANLATQWTALLAKYSDLVSRAIYDPSNPLKGINDLPIGDGTSTDNLFYELTFTAPRGYSLMSDYRNVISPQTTIATLAERYALTEYILLNKLSSSVSFNTDSIARLNTPDGNPTVSMGSDSHEAGKYAHTLVYTLFHRAGAACLLELITQLKAADMFNDVVIREAGEFNRIPNRFSTGSDHGSSGLSQVFYSGAFNGPLIVGNLAKATSPSSWGRGGVIPELGRQLNPTDMIVTLAHLLRVPAPLTSARSIVTLSSSGLASNIGLSSYV